MSVLEDLMAMADEGDVQQDEDQLATAKMSSSGVAADGWHYLYDKICVPSLDKSVVGAWVQKELEGYRLRGATGCSREGWLISVFQLGLGVYLSPSLTLSLIRAVG